ncbi:hypothetical protein A2U01_0060338, partial [Trifolium medium]|nr:hypothetical protein [Trifolium medium]
RHGAARRFVRLHLVLGSDERASRRFMRRGARLQVFFTRVAHVAGRVAPARNLYMFSSFSDLGLVGQN